MSSWGNTDSIYDKPHWSEERQVRPFASLVTANNTTSGNTIVFVGSGANTAANIGIAAGMYIYGTNASITGEQEFFTSNNYVVSVSVNTVRLANNVMGSIASGTSLDFGTNILYNQNTANTYFGDTVLVSSSRLANTVGFANTSTAHVGWQHVTTGTGGRAGRVQVETLVALSNTAIANTNSGRTSNTNTYYTGV